MRERELVLFGYAVLAAASFMIGSYAGELIGGKAASDEVAALTQPQTAHAATLEQTADDADGMPAGEEVSGDVDAETEAASDQITSEASSDPVAEALAEADRFGNSDGDTGEQSASGWDNTKWGQSEWDNTTWDNADSDSSDEEDVSEDGN